MGGYFEKKIKNPFTCLKWETILGGCFEKNFLKNKKSPLDLSNRKERMVWNYQIVNFTVLTSQN